MSVDIEFTAWRAPAVRLEPVSLAPGESGRLVVTLDVPDGCHIQSHEPAEPFLIATRLHLDPAPPGIELGRPSYPSPSLERFEWTPIVLAIYRGRVEIEVPVDVGPDFRRGLAVVSGRLRYQGCTTTACLPPADHEFEVDLEIEPARSRSARAVV